MQTDYIAGLILTLLLLGIMSCSHAISKEAREIAVKDIPFQWIAENPDRYRGAFVIWGGEIIDSKPQGEGIFIEVLQRPLARSEEPDETQNSRGRFLILYKAGLLNPAVFRKGTKITVAGIVEGQKTLQMEGVAQMGNYSYPYLTAKEVHLWENKGIMNQYEYPYY